MKYFTLFLFLLLAGQWSMAQSQPTDDDRGYIVKVGDEVPDFQMTLLDGSLLKMSDLKGKVVMLQFTASWCSVCRKEMPFIESDIWKKHKDNPNFALLGIDKDEKAEVVQKFVVSTGISYPMVLDHQSVIFEKFAQKKAGVTRNVIVDKTGRIGMLTRLYNEEEFAEMVKVIDNLLSK